MSEKDGKRYWDAEAERFDSIYAEDGSVRGILNRLLRKDMAERTHFMLKHAQLEASPRILEIGCGTGIHTRLLLQGGAGHVTGIDFSPVMLQLAARRLQGFTGRFDLLEGDFMTCELGEMFDVTTIIGVFDYVARPVDFLRKAAAASARRVIATFPRAGALRAVIRKARLSAKGCPVYFYSEAELPKLAESCNVRIAVRETIGQLHCVVFDPVSTNGES